nr:immunoglobulin light chain junction region [Macaca mulatta]MOV61152.1 immunoglobulin light chain junction region [Macaca mulatta]MOV61364.1 immunoglobulin light chain junction region [Macaca mulatta]MOV61424.1 immunoglobulin light chain junction region [Macaca mulatta]MOV61736.1 immunoglobulin light chain junction region [Macaca mulatta]
CMQALEFPYSF